jgi:hypothetical protein
MLDKQAEEEDLVTRFDRKTVGVCERLLKGCLPATEAMIGIHKLEQRDETGL